MNDLLKKALAEAIGTFVLVFCACGAASVADNVIAAALAFGLVIVAMAYSIGKISGCHINPAVSLGAFMTGKLSLKEFLVYCGAQVVGGLVGGVAFYAIVKMGFAGYNIEIDASNYAIAYVLDHKLTAGGVFGAIFLELILTCIFVYVILNVTDESGVAGKKAGLIIGLTLTLVHLVGVPLTGTSVNPARSIATAFAGLIFYGNGHPFASLWIFILAPMGGGALAALLYKALHGAKKAA